MHDIAGSQELAGLVNIEWHIRTHKVMRGRVVYGTVVGNITHTVYQQMHRGKLKQRRKNGNKTNLFSNCRSLSRISCLLVLVRWATEKNDYPRTVHIDDDGQQHGPRAPCVHLLSPPSVFSWNAANIMLVSTTKHSSNGWKWVWLHTQPICWLGATSENKAKSTK